MCRFVSLERAAAERLFLRFLRVSRWIANLLPVQSADKYALLTADTIKARLDRELQMLTTAQGRCSIM